MKATNNCPVRYNFVSIPLIFTFSSRFKEVELSFFGAMIFGFVLDHKMITRQSSAAQNRASRCKARENVVTVLAEF